MATIEFLSLLQREVDLTNETDLLEPPDPVAPKEQPVGVLSDHLKRLYTVWRRAGHALNVHLADVQLMKADRRREEEPRLDAQHRKMHAVADIFWIAVSDELQLWGKRLAVREGWTVVVQNDEDDQRGMLPTINVDPDSMRAMLRRLFGGE